VDGACGWAGTRSRTGGVGSSFFGAALCGGGEAFELVVGVDVVELGAEINEG